MEKEKLLTTILTSDVVHTKEGQELPLHSHILPKDLAVLKEKADLVQPKIIIEVGMAYGISSLVLAEVVTKYSTDGLLISIDPNQSTDWKGIGKLNLERAGFSEISTVIEKPSYLVLPKLIEDGVVADFCFIDGWHTFDYVLLDVFFCHRLLRRSGVLCLDDCRFPSIYKVCNWILANRDYEEVTPIFKHPYKCKSIIKSVAGWILRRPIKIPVRYFRKKSNHEPNWDEFPKF